MKKFSRDWGFTRPGGHVKLYATSKRALIKNFKKDSLSLHCLVQKLNPVASTSELTNLKTMKLSKFNYGNDFSNDIPFFLRALSVSFGKRDMRPSGFRKYSEVLKLNLHDSDGLDYYWNYVSREENFFQKNGNNQASL